MRGFVLIVLLWWPALVVGEAIVAEGVASTTIQSVPEARREALKDALWSASSQSGTTIRGEIRLSQGVVVSDDSRFRIGTHVSRYEVISEGQEGDLYRVQVRVEETQTGCGALAGMRIGAVSFPLLKPHQHTLMGVTGVEMGVPNEILHRVGVNTPLEVHRAAHRRLFPPLNGNLPNPRSDRVRERARGIAAELGVDFLVAGVVLDIGYESVGMLRNRHSRRAEVEVYLFKAESGELMGQRRAARESRGDVLVSSRVSFGSQRFYESDYGEGFGWVMDILSQEILSTLNCPPRRDSQR